MDIRTFKYELIDGYNICCQCSIISNPRSITWGGTFDRTIDDEKKLDRKIDLMLIGQNPWFNNNKNDSNIYGRAFGDKSEQILNEYFTKHSFDLSKIWITNGVQCSVKDNDPLNVEKAFENCQHFLITEIEYVRPKIIAPMGKTIGALLLKLDLKQYKVIPILHPNALSHNPNLTSKFDEQLSNLRKLI